MAFEAINLFIFVAGLVLVIKGADWITEYGSLLAKRHGVSELVIGLTLVAMATSLPELSVSLLSVFSGVAQIATGTVIGSNISNITLILGLSALACPLATGKEFLKEGYVTLGFSVLIAIFLLSGMAWYEGVVILVLFVAYLVHSVNNRKAGDKKPKPMARETGIEKTGGGAAKHVLFIIIAGLVIVGGAELLITSTVNIAEWLGVPEIIIAMVIIAIGTSLPELATSVTAAVKRMRGISLGNIIGSNIFNIAVLGITSLFASVPVTYHVVSIDIPFMIAVTALLLIFIKTGWKLDRREGIALLLIYALFVALQFVV